MSAAPIVLSINVGSSSVKFALFDFSVEGGSRLAEGAITQIGLAGGALSIRGTDGATRREERRFENPEAGVVAALGALEEARLPAPSAVGHRIVHGGPTHAEPVRVDATVLASLRDAVPFAPLHLPAELRGIEAVTFRFPGIVQVACFDTAFHAGLPEVARRLPLPRALSDRGVRKYGFHGLSYEYVVLKVGPEALGRAVLAHLGSGASLAAVRNGASVDTTMGLTPTGGIMMGTRTGDLDPGVVLHLLGAGYDAPKLEQTLNHDSGLKGVSETTSDMKELLAKRGTDPRAALAVEMFAYQIRKSIGGFAAALGGLDTLVFTGGIGERAAEVRALACRGLEHLGVRIDGARNADSAGVISPDGGGCVVRVVAADEEIVVARHTVQVAKEGRPG